MRTVGYALLVSVRRRFDCIVDQLHIFLRDFKTSGTCERAKIYDTQRWGWGGGGGGIISFLFSIPFAHRPLPFSNETERAGQAYQGQRFYSQDHPSSSEETLEELDPR